MEVRDAGSDPVFSIPLTCKERITDIGLRVIVTSFLIDDGRFKHGKLENISDNEVMIFIDGIHGDVEDMTTRLGKRLEKASEDKNLMIPKDIKIGRPAIVKTNPHPIELPELKDFAQSLMLEQTGKGVCVMSKGFNSLGGKVDEGFGSLGRKTDDGFSLLGEKFDRMTGLLRSYLERER